MKYRRVKKIIKNKLSIIIAAFAVLSILTVVSIIYFNYQINIATEIQAQERKKYDKHYAIVTDSDSVYDSFWQEVYNGCKKEGEKTNITIERTGENIRNDYTKSQLMKMAITSGADGIILQGDDSREIKDLIAEAEENKIPVITVLTDSVNSKRKSFIGIGGYDLGRTYAREIIRIATKNTKDVLILANANSELNNQSIVIAGLKQTITNEGNHLKLKIDSVSVDNTSAFSAEEAIRDIFINTKKLPDIVICLNEKNTISAYQTVVDYNIVGRVNIIGYYNSEIILKAIEKNVISSSVTVDSQEMGALCVDTLNEYFKTGHVSEYASIEVNSVTEKNVERYRQHAINGTGK